MKNTKKKKNVNPEFVVVGNSGLGDGPYDNTILVTRDKLDMMISKRGTSWIKRMYKLGNEVKFLPAEYVDFPTEIL